MRKLKRLLCIAFAVILSFSISVQVFGAETEQGDLPIDMNYAYGVVNDGFVPELPDLPEEVAYEAFPESYDPRVTNATTPVKSQLPHNTCGIFATLATLERTVYQKTGIKESLSEEAMRYTQSNFTKTVLGHKPDMGFYIRGPRDGMGGVASITYISRQNSPIVYEDNLFWLSPNLMTDVKYTKEEKEENFAWPSNMDTSYATNYATEIEFINPVENVIKSKIIENGAVYTVFYYNGNYEIYKNGAYYYPYEKYPNHAISILGWDDNFSRNNFSENCRPNNNGAWLIKNSWGTTWGESGYGWISYEDKSLSTGDITFAINEIAPVSKNEYTLSYDYIPAATGDEITLTGNNNYACIANVYDVSELADEYGKINKVTFYTGNIGTSYEIYVVPVKADDTTMPSMDELGDIKAQGTIDFSGFRTAEFSKPYEISTNAEKVAVIVKFIIDRSKTSIIKGSRESNTGGHYDPQIYSGESYCYANGAWKDISENNLKGLGNYSIRPTLVRRNSITENSFLSTTLIINQGKEETVDIELNGNRLYSIKNLNDSTILYEDVDFTKSDILDDGIVTGTSIKLKKSFFDSLSLTEDTNLEFVFTDGNSQKLLIWTKAKLTNAGVSGKVARGQKLTASVTCEDGPVSPSDVTYQWQSSSDGTTWTNIIGAKSSTYTLTNNEFLKYVRVKVSSIYNGGYYYPQIIFSPSTQTKVIIYGDVNLDGIVDISDATDVQFYLADFKKLNAEQLVAADVDGDGDINITDVTAIQQYAAGQISKFPVEE